MKAGEISSGSQHVVVNKAVGMDGTAKGQGVIEKKTQTESWRTLNI